MVIKAFNHTIKNEYKVDTDYRASIAQSKFTLCPPGMGMDTYRLWETLLLGSIPIVESDPAGLDRMYMTLPVLVVKRYEDVTPALLELAYPCFVRHASEFEYDILTNKYWRTTIDAIIMLGKVEGVTATLDLKPPYINRYCNFM